MPVTILLKAMGSSTQFILNFFYNVESVLLEKGRLSIAVNESLIGEKAPEDVVAKGGEVIAKKGRKISKPLIKKMIDSGITRIPVNDENIIGRITSSDVLDPKTGEILMKCNEELTAEALQLFRDKESLRSSLSISMTIVRMRPSGTPCSWIRSIRRKTPLSRSIAGFVRATRLRLRRPKSFFSSLFFEPESLRSFRRLGGQK